jgi:hypothetical protein
MAAGFDELLDYLLSEIALCGVQGMPDPLHHFFFLFCSIEHFLPVCALTLVNLPGNLTAVVDDCFVTPRSHHHQ